MKLSSMINAVDLHASGQHARVIVGGVHDVRGDTVFEKMVYLRDKKDELRRRMLREPRGFPTANCNLLVPSNHRDADIGFVIMEQVEYPVMSGHNTICVVTAILETGILEATEPLTKLVLESPAGLIPVRASVRDGKVTRVEFTNVPSFVLHLDQTIEVPHLGKATVDVAYGGMFYVIADATQFDLEVTPRFAADLTRVGEMIKVRAQEIFAPVHPTNRGISGITVSALTSPSMDGRSDLRGTAIQSNGILDWERPNTWTGTVDRSPAGTATSAVMAVRHAKGLLGVGETFVYEGILGIPFEGRIIETTSEGSLEAITPAIAGQAWITGFANYVVDPTDPFPNGFTVGDMWGDTVDTPLLAVDG